MAHKRPLPSGNALSGDQSTNRLPGEHAPSNPKTRGEIAPAIELWIALMADVVAAEVIQRSPRKEEPLDAKIHTIETH